MSNFSLCSPDRPHDGSVVTAQEMRELLRSASTFNAGSLEPRGDAVIIGDARIIRVNASSQYILSLDINGTTNDVDIRTHASNAASVSPAEIVDAINSSFEETVAFVYSAESFDSSAYIGLVAPRGVIADPYITVNVNEDGLDASELVLALAGRGSGMPYTVTSADVPYGTTWLKTTNDVDDDIKIFLGTPATALGSRDMSLGSGTIDMTVRNKLRIKLIGPSVSWPSGVNPLDIDVSGATPAATTPEEIVDAINDAFTALVGWTGTGPASLVTRNNTGKFIKIVAGPTDGPYRGPSARVELSNIAIGGAAGVNFLADDAITEVFGLPKGERDLQFSRLPHVFQGVDFSNSFIRSIGSRTGAGIGVWGTSMETAGNIPYSGNIDGEIRVAKDSGIPWVYRSSNIVFGGSTGGGWKRAIPGSEYPLSYDKSEERLRILNTNDSFVPQPLDQLGYDNFANVQRDANATEAGNIGDAVTLTDGRDYKWSEADYTDGRNPYTQSAVWDNFRLAATTLTRTWEGLRWNTVDPSTNVVSPSRLRVTANNLLGGHAETSAVSSGFDNGALTAVLDGAGTVRFHAPGNASVGPHTFTIPGVSVSAPIKTGTLHIWLSSLNSDGASVSTSSTPYSYRGFDDGAGNIGGTGVTGVVNYLTGVVTVTFSSAINAFDTIGHSYAQSDILAVAVDVRKDPDAEARSSGTACEAGIIYGAHSTPATAVMEYDSGFAVTIDDTGVGRIYSIDGGVPEQIGSVFIVDPPLDTNWRTLRVIHQVQGTNSVHSIFWNGSNKPVDWNTKDSAGPETGLQSSQTNGGSEFDRGTKLVSLQYIPLSVLDGLGGSHALNATGHSVGIWAKGVPATGSLLEKKVQFSKFQSHGGKKSSFFNPIPALPPVSGVRLRDSVNAVRVLKNGDLDSSRIITDCTHASPLLVNLLGDLANADSGITTNIDGTTSRQLDIALAVAPTLARKDLRYCSANLEIPLNPGYVTKDNAINLNGVLAKWSLSQVVNTTIDTLSVAPGIKGYSFSLGRRVDVTTNFNTMLPGIRVNNYYYLDTSLGLRYTGFSQYPQFKRDYAPLSLTVFTTLPRSGHNGIDWIYHVDRADVGSAISSNLQVAGPNNPWSNNLLNNWNIGDQYQIPKVIAVYPSGDLSQNFASFTVVISYWGPVCPNSLDIEITATRVGIE